MMELLEKIVFWLLVSIGGLRVASFLVDILGTGTVRLILWSDKICQK